MTKAYTIIRSLDVRFGLQLIKAAISNVNTLNNITSIYKIKNNRCGFF